MNVKVMAIVAAAWILALASAGASANRSISIRGLERGVASSGRLIIGNERLSTELERIIACEVTLLRTVTRSVEKRAGAIFGKVTGMAIRYGGGECSVGPLLSRVDQFIALKESSSELLANSNCAVVVGNIILCNTTGGRPELWNLVYDSFAGVLPNFTSFNFHIANAQIKLRLTDIFNFPIACLFEGNVPFVWRLGRGGAMLENEINLEQTRLGVLRQLEGFCFNPPYRLSGAFRTSPQGTASLV